VAICPLTQNNDGEVLCVVMAENPCLLRAAVTAFATWPAFSCPGCVVEQVQGTLVGQVLFDGTPFCAGAGDPAGKGWPSCCAQGTRAATPLLVT
jgi:hypothetical protein